MSDSASSSTLPLRLGKFLTRAVLALLFLMVAIAASLAQYLKGMDADPGIKPSREMSEVWYDFPFASRYVSVHGSKMHYVDEGMADGPVFLFLHGNPTSSYLWRQVLHAVASAGARVIAVDNIGFGASDRPDLAYTFTDHRGYLDGFIQALGLQDITLVVHDWGSALGFDYARRNPDNVSGIVFMEAMTRLPSFARMSAMLRFVFKSFRVAGAGELLVMGANFFVEKALPMNVLRTLEEREMAAYREPFPSVGSRLPTLVWPREIPFDGHPADTTQVLQEYLAWLPNSPHPKLLLHADPGALINIAHAEEIRDKWRNTEVQLLGEGLHYLQEDLGPEIGQAIAQWHQDRAAEHGSAREVLNPH